MKALGKPCKTNEELRTALLESAYKDDEYAEELEDECAFSDFPCHILCPNCKLSKKLRKKAKQARISAGFDKDTGICSECKGKNEHKEGCSTSAGEVEK